MTRKNFYQTTKRHQLRLKNNIKDKLKQIQRELLIPHGLEFRKVEIGPYIEQEDIENFKCDLVYINSNIEESVSIKKVIYIKDKNNISDDTYKSLRNELKLKLPSLYKLKNEIEKYDEMFDIMENSKGVYIDIKKKLKELILRIKHKFINKDDNILHIKFSADGAQIIKHKLILNLTFTVLNEGKIAETASGNYTCGLFDITKEDYDVMCTCLNEIKFQINDLNEIEVDNIKYKIEKYIGGDLKMLALIYGINQASSNCPCIWCIWDKRSFDNDDIEKVDEAVQKDWSIKDVEKGARTIEEALHSQNKFGYINKPILSIPFDRVIVDTLHLFLRISGVLYDLFIVSLRNLDGKQKNEIDLSRQPHLNQFFLDLKENYNIKAPFSVVDKSIKIRELQGPDKKKLFQDCNLKKYAEGNEKFDKTEVLWKDFWKLFNQIKKSEITPNDIKKNTKKWLSDFTAIYDATHITPYMHCFANHLHEFVNLYGDVNRFNLEGLEKLNHLTHSHVFRATNRHTDYLKQIMRKRNRIEVSCRD